VAALRARRKICVRSEADSTSCWSRCHLRRCERTAGSP
jgi:hypothetical protein